jgi:mannose-6-phosphate isomerase-like protein (cupin superfamily)
MTTDANIAARIKALLDSLADPVLAAFIGEWPSLAVHRAVAPAALPVLRWLPDIAGDTAAFGIDLVAALCREASSLAWRQTYTAKDLDAAFLDDYGWSEILGGNGPWESGRVACGFLILGPSTHYPRHRHEAEELYLPLSGTARWQQGDGEWLEMPPGTLIHHAREEPHAMRTGGRPLLALYLWRSGNLAQKARLDSGKA